MNKISNHILNHISATGNDFLLFDNRNSSYCDELQKQVVSKMISENIDGLILLSFPSESSSHKYHFRMNYFNRDGREVELCGNGLRAISWYAFNILKITGNNYSYCIETMNGSYKSNYHDKNIKIKMTEFSKISELKILDLYSLAKNSLFINVGVPHCVFELNSKEELQELNLVDISSPIRFEKRFKNGTNVNFFYKISDTRLMMRTFERGVESETLSCGTGACAVAFLATQLWENNVWEIETRGGQLFIDIFDSYFYLAGSVQSEGEFYFQV